MVAEQVNLRLCGKNQLPANKMPKLKKPKLSNLKSKLMSHSEKLKDLKSKVLEKLKVINLKDTLPKLKSKDIMNKVNKVNKAKNSMNKVHKPKPMDKEEIKHIHTEFKKLRINM